MSLEVLAMIVAGLGISFILLLFLAIRQMRPGRSMRLAVPRLSRRASPRKANPTDRAPIPSAATSEAPVARRRTLASISQVGQERPLLSPTADDSLAAEVIGRLEQTFSLLERGRISLETYAHDVGLIRREVLLRLEEIERSRSSRKACPDMIERQRHDASSALEAIAWCQEWAKQQADAGGSGSAASTQDQRECPPLTPA